MDNTKPKLVLLDIDGTLFDSKSYRVAFKDLIVEKTGVGIESFEDIEEQAYRSFSIFEPRGYLTLLLDRLGKQSQIQELEILISSDAFLEKFLYEDVNSFLESIPPGAKIGILSRGDPSIQEAKIKNVKGFLDPERVYILPDKIGSAKQIVELNADFRVYFIDDTPEVLDAYKKEDSSWSVILIERDGVKDYNGNSDFKVRSLIEALEYIRI